MRLFFKILLVVLALHVAWNFRSCSYGKLSSILSDKMLTNALMKVERNYGTEVESICKELNAPPEYFKALILLESSASKPAKSRYEPHVFDALKEVKEGKRNSYSGLHKKDLKRYSNQELTMLATSWGPLQIMGYHVVKKGITIDDLRGDDGVKLAIEWCLENYGNYLERGDYKNAFHIHNTGRKHPFLWQSQTHDPLYVDKGLIYAESLR